MTVGWQGQRSGWPPGERQTTSRHGPKLRSHRYTQAALGSFMQLQRSWRSQHRVSRAAQPRCATLGNENRHLTNPNGQRCEAFSHGENRVTRTWPKSPRLRANANRRSIARILANPATKKILHSVARWGFSLSDVRPPRVRGVAATLGFDR